MSLLHRRQPSHREPNPTTVNQTQPPVNHSSTRNQNKENEGERRIINQQETKNQKQHSSTRTRKSTTKKVIYQQSETKKYLQKTLKFKKKTKQKLEFLINSMKHHASVRSTTMTILSQITFTMSLKRHIKLLSKSQPRQSNPYILTLLQTNPQILYKMVHKNPWFQIPLQYPLSIQIKTARVPFLAPRSPPDTGASMEWLPLDAAVAAISTAREGSDVVMSTRIPPLRRPERRRRWGRGGRSERRKGSQRWRRRRRSGRRRREGRGQSGQRGEEGSVEGKGVIRERGGEGEVEGGGTLIWELV